MEPLTIPTSRKTLTLSVTRLWNGEACSDAKLHAMVSLARSAEGIVITAEAPLRNSPLIPNAPEGCRVANLWEYDVVELFLVRHGHDYLEIELGAGGHFLILDFDEVRDRRNEYLDFVPEFHHTKRSAVWRSEILIPFSIIGPKITALNAFVIAGGQFLAYSPLPGPEPDFHQPDFYPTASLK